MEILAFLQVADVGYVGILLLVGLWYSGILISAHRGSAAPRSVENIVSLVPFFIAGLVLIHGALLALCLFISDGITALDASVEGLLTFFWLLMLVVVLKTVRHRAPLGLPILWGFVALRSLGATIMAAVLLIVHLHTADGKWRMMTQCLVARLVLTVVDAVLVFTNLCLTGRALSSPRAGGLTDPLLSETWKESDRRWQLVFGALKYVWPDTWRLKLRLLACACLLLVGRAVNFLVPVLYKEVVDVLSRISKSTPEIGTPECLKALRMTFGQVFTPWVLAYLIAYFLQGGKGGDSGLLGNMRDLLWIPITQRAYKRVSMDVFRHLLSLDMNFHLNRKTGQMMRILDRGTSSVQDMVAIILFNVLPQIADIIIACTYIATALEGWIAIVVFLTVASYIPITIAVTERRGKVRKQMNKLDSDKEQRATDMLLCVETVKCFGMEPMELNLYGTAIDKFQEMESMQLTLISTLQILQSIVLFLGVASGTCVCVAGVIAERLTVGDTVLFLALMGQLISPLNSWASYYRQVQKGLIDMEAMFAILATVPRVRDSPSAAPLQVLEGAISFDNVSFGYSPANYVISQVSFFIPGGQTFALVGATGSGKSTTTRLLLRFYDPHHGVVSIDGQDISQVTQASLRQAIGVVPQDCVLFNDSVQFNISYSRPDASTDEVENAAKVAAIHNSILNFPKGYRTRVGERGLRLSGGEKQRVALARVILKDPAILILDEATSALDSITEKSIQESLQQVRRRCTTVIVAHRLSTVMDAEQILVLEHGIVAERGTHLELLERNGLYATMWARQQEASLAGQSEVTDDSRSEPTISPFAVGSML